MTKLCFLYGIYGYYGYYGKFLGLLMSHLANNWGQSCPIDNGAIAPHNTKQPCQRLTPTDSPYIIFRRGHEVFCKE